MARKATSENAVNGNPKDREPPLCGVIMPISATASFSEAHWAKVQILLHRAIRQAGFEPNNVWENSTKDRISERIIGNIFKHDIIVADISDLNPNVMLELGLRLASKKPTIVITVRGAPIPFDIRDFEAVLYPPDLSMLEMEEFFEQLSVAMKTKYEAFNDDNYSPFLGNLVVDVLSPKEREVPLDKLILSRLDEMDRRLSNISNGKTSPEQRIVSNLNIHGISFKDHKFYVSLKSGSYDEFADELKSRGYIWRTTLIESEGDIEYYETYAPGISDKMSRDIVEAAVSAIDGAAIVPASYMQRLARNRS